MLKAIAVFMGMVGVLRGPSFRFSGEVAGQLPRSWPACFTIETTGSIPHADGDVLLLQLFLDALQPFIPGDGDGSRIPRTLQLSRRVLGKRLADPLQLL